MKSLPLITQNVNQLLHKTAAAYPDRTALIYKGRRWTYREFDHLTDCLASGLLKSGIRRGDHIGLLSENSENAVFAFLAVEKAGAVACMLNTSLHAQEMAELCQLSDIRYLMIGSGYKNIHFYPEILKLMKLYPLEKIFDIAGFPTSSFCNIQSLITLGKEHLGAYKKNEETIRPEDDGLILYTSGTTGKTSKAVVSTYYQIANGGRLKASSLAMNETDIVCCVLQFFHIFCIDVNIMAAMATGACLVLPDDLHSKSILTAIDIYHCTVFNCVPCRFHALSARPDFNQFDISGIRTGIIGGAYCSPEDFTRFEKLFDMTLLPGLGQTEAIAGISIADPDDSLELRSTTVGHFVDHCEGKIANPADGRPLPAGETGEICIRGPLVMKGYYKRPDLTAQVIDKDGWFHTGDLGRLDGNGYVHYIGRIKEIINRGGEKIIPSEVESVINTIPEVESSKVIPFPDSHYGEIPCACIILKDGCTVYTDKLMQYLKQNMADFKVPEKIVYLDEYPMNATGKIQLQELINIAKQADNPLSACS